MGSFVRAGLGLGLGLGLLPGLLAAQVAPGVPETLARRVAQQIATTWDVPVAALTLSWGGLPPGLDAQTDAPIAMAGRGADGWFTTVLRPDAPGPVTALRVRAGLPDTVLVAARFLASGARIDSSDVRPAIRTRWGPPTEQAAPRPDVGWEVRRPFAPGDVVAWPAAEPPFVIAGGQTVRVVWARGGVVLSWSGVAAGRARLGEEVRVKVEGRPSRLVGRLTAPGLVTLSSGGAP